MYLFHGTHPDVVEDIAEDGLQFRRGGPAYQRRYGEGNYFTDESCKAQQYAGAVEQPDGSTIHTLLYCRVAVGNALKFEVTGQDSAAQYLAGMLAPSPEDAVFRRKMTERGSADQADERWDSVIAQAADGVNRADQIHREVVTFNTWQCYPEYVVQYRTDTLEEQLEKEAAALMKEAAALMAAAMSEMAKHRRRRAAFRELEELDDGASDQSSASRYRRQTLMDEMNSASMSTATRLFIYQIIQQQLVDDDD